MSVILVTRAGSIMADTPLSALKWSVASPVAGSPVKLAAPEYEIHARYLDRLRREADDDRDTAGTQALEGRRDRLAAEVIDLGVVSGVAYYTVERDGFRVVATLAKKDEDAVPVRVVAVLA